MRLGEPKRGWYWNNDAQKTFCEPEVNQSPNASPQNLKDTHNHTSEHFSGQLCTHAHTGSYAAPYTRDINTLGLIIMIRTEAQSTLGIITHFLCIVSQGQKQPNRIAKTTFQENKPKYNCQKVNPNSIFS